MAVVPLVGVILIEEIEDPLALNARRPHRAYRAFVTVSP